MKVTLEVDDCRLDCSVNDGAILLDTLLENRIHPDTVIVLKDGRPVPEDMKVEDGDVFTVVKVASGG